VNDDHALFALELATPWSTGAAAMLWMRSIYGAWVGTCRTQLDSLSVAAAAREMRSSLEALERQEAIAALL
jgi:hypothetical protein